MKLEEVEEVLAYLPRPLYFTFHLSRSLQPLSVFTLGLDGEITRFCCTSHLERDSGHTNSKDERSQVDETAMIDEAELTPTASKQILVLLFKYYIKTQNLLSSILECRKLRRYR